MGFWTAAFCAGLLMWIGIGKLVNSETKSGELFREFLQRLMDRLFAKRDELPPDHKED